MKLARLALVAALSLGLAAPAFAQVRAPIYNNTANQPAQAQGVFNVPGSNVGLTPTVTTGAASGVAKTSAGALYSVRLTFTAATGALLYFHAQAATAVPADGAVTPQVCIPIPSGQLSFIYDFTTGGIPEAFATGISWWVSTTTGATACSTKALYTNASVIEAAVKFQ